ALNPEYRGRLQPLDDPKAYFAALSERARQRSVPPGGRIVMYTVPPYPDQEEARLRKIMREHGIDVVTPYTKHRLLAKDEGLFVRVPTPRGERLERVGFLFLNEEAKWADARHPATRLPFLLHHARLYLSGGATT